MKLAGANAVIALIALVAAVAVDHNAISPWQLLVVLGTSLAVGLLVNLVLVNLALRPIRDLERTAQLVSKGDYAARVPGSPFADAKLERVGRTLNLVLDGLIRERERMHDLASEVIRTGDRERALLAHELHDSVAQSLAALQYQLGSAEKASAGSPLAEPLAEARNLLKGTLEEVRLLAQTTHPRVLEDLGLVAGLRYLARTIGEGTQVPISVETAAATGSGGGGAAVPPEKSSVLYRVAQEAVQNAVRHAHATRIEVQVELRPEFASVRVVDDGDGFTPAEAQARSQGMGIFVMRERVALAGGEFAIEAVPGRGTSVKAIIPLNGTSRGALADSGVPTAPSPRIIPPNEAKHAR